MPHLFAQVWHGPAVRDCSRIAKTCNSRPSASHGTRFGTDQRCVFGHTLQRRAVFAPDMPIHGMSRFTTVCRVWHGPVVRVFSRTAKTCNARPPALTRDSLTPKKILNKPILNSPTSTQVPSHARARGRRIFRWATGKRPRRWMLHYGFTGEV